MNIGTFGVWTSYRPFGIERAGEAAKLLEQLGYGTWWLGGSPLSAARTRTLRRPTRRSARGPTSRPRSPGRPE